MHRNSTRCFPDKIRQGLPYGWRRCSEIYQSQACKKAIETAADVIGIPRGHVFPVKNYEQETQLQTNVSIVALTAMRQTLVFADDYLEDQYELQSDQ